MGFGIVLLVVAAVALWYSGTLTNQVTRTVTLSLALTLALWGVLSIVSNFWFLVLLVLGIVVYVYYKRGANR